MKNEIDKACSQEKDINLCLCPLEGVIHLIGKKWTLQLIAIIGNNKKIRFKEIMEKLECISPKSLTDRLKELEKERLVKREAYAEIPPRVEYSLTKDGMELRNNIMQLMKWAYTKNIKIK